MQQARTSTTLFDEPAQRVQPAASAELTLSRAIYRAVRGSADGIVTITPLLAKRILDLLNFSKQRLLKPSNVLVLQTKILGGLWQPAHPICFARMDELLIGVNLQHRLRAIIAADLAVEVRVLIVDCADEQAVATLYGEFDPKSGARSDVDSIVASDLGSASGLSMATVSAAMSALKVVMHNMHPIGGAMTANKVIISMVETRMAEFPNWVAQVQTWDRIMRSAPYHVRTKLKTAGVMAVGLYTIKHQPQAALAFWQGLADNNLLARTDPRACLLADFQSRKGATAREVVQSAAHAWNAWYDNRKLNNIRCDNGAPLTFAGTPLASRRR